MRDLKKTVKILKLIRAAYKVLFVVIILFAVISSSAYLFIALKGKNIILAKIEELTQRKASVGNFSVTPPLNLVIKNLNIEGLLKVEDISISPSILFLLTGNIALNRIVVIKPEITFEKKPAEEADLSYKESVSKTPLVAPEKKRALHLILKQLIIKDGKIDFVDHTVGPEGIKIIVKDINFNLTNLHAFPFSAITNFELKAKIPWQKGREEGRIEAEGWINFFKKDMQATLKIEDIDGVYLYPYYSHWVDLEKARIEKAKLNFTSNINGLNNNVTAQCRLELTDIVRRPRPEGELGEKAEKITDAVLDIFRALNQGKIVLDFTIRTKMDKPQFGFGDIKMAFEDKLAEGKKANGFKPEDALLIPAKLIEALFKGTTDLTTAVISGTISAGKEIGKTVEGAMKKEEKKE